MFTCHITQKREFLLVSTEVLSTQFTLVYLHRNLNKMAQWNDQEGGGYFNGNEPSTPAQSNKTVARQQFLCPVTVGQVLEAPEEGLKIGSLTATMVSLLGIVTDIESTSTNVKFSLTDDTGAIDCVEWLESEDDGKPKSTSNLAENKYYRVFGCVKSPQGRQRIMVFKTVPVKDFNEVTAFILEVLNVNDYAEKAKKMPNIPAPVKNEYNSYNSFGTSGYDDNRTAFTPVQKAVLDAIKAVGTQVGWSKYDPEIRKIFSAKQIQDALDFLVGEGHIYTTVDDDHFCST